MPARKATATATKRTVATTPVSQREQIALPTIAVAKTDEAIPEDVGAGRRPRPEFLQLKAAMAEANKYPANTFSVQNIATEAQANKVIRYLRKAAQDLNSRVKVVWKEPQGNTPGRVLFQSQGFKATNGSK